MVNAQAIWINNPHSHTIIHFLRIRVLAACLKASAVGAPLLPTFRIFSPLPAAIRFFLAWMFAYNPGFLFGIGKPFHGFLENSVVGDCTVGARGRGQEVLFQMWQDRGALVP